MILTVNSGSTSVKLAAFEHETLELIHADQRSGSNLDAAETLRDFLSGTAGGNVRIAVHRVVHGGLNFSRPVRIDRAVLEELERLGELAPLHNPPALRWIAAARAVCGPGVEHIAVFDTGFFAQLPPVATHYAIPLAWATGFGIRRYGFHGIAHQAMWRRWCELNPQLEAGGRLIALQLGGGCSVSAILKGRPLDTSMGFSPLEGLMMATRSGDIDPAVIPYLAKRWSLSSEELVAKLNRECGLGGMSQHSSSLGELINDPSTDARLAVDLYCYRIRKYIGAYLAVLGGCDGIVFGGGVGEHVPAARERVLAELGWAGIELDLNANHAALSGEAEVHAKSSRVQIRVLPADEALSLARAAIEFRD